MAAGNANSIDDNLRTAIETGDLPCVVAMAATPQQELYAGAYGTRTVGLDQPVALNTIFRLHSMTKAITATAALQLVERGLANLDEPAEKVLPELQQIRVLDGFEPDDTPRYRPARTPITLRMMLNHTAGFSYDIWNANTLKHQQVTGLPSPFSGKRQALFQPLLSDPGAEWRYSIAIDWVGQYIEAVAGVDLETWFQREIFSPLGMTDTTFIPTDEQKARRVAMHRRQPDGTIVPVVSERPDVTEIYLGGGGLFGSVPDYLRFTTALLRGGAPLLGPAMMQLMRQSSIGSLSFQPMRTVNRNVSCDYDPWPEMDRKWSLAFLINTEPTPEGRSAGSLSWGGLSNLHFWIDYTRGVTGVFASQTLPFNEPRATRVFQAFERQIYALL